MGDEGWRWVMMKNLNAQLQKEDEEKEGAFERRKL